MMTSLEQFVTVHWIAISFGAAYFFIAVVETMPKPGDPRPTSQKLYNWVYDVVHLLSNKVAERKPGAVPTVAVEKKEITVNA